MFKTATLHRYRAPGGIAIETLLAQLEPHAFAPCGPTQALSIGWVPPRNQDHGALVESIDGQWIAKLMIETKKVPADVVERMLDERCAAIEKMTGRKVGKKERRESKEDIVLSLLPVAFASRSAVLVWLDSRSGLLVLDATGAKADLALTALVQAIDGFTAAPIKTVLSPADSMAKWLELDEWPDEFEAGRSCELKATDETGAKVRYDHHAVEIEEIIQHIVSGKRPTRLALTWDDRVAFVLTDALALKSIDLLDATIDIDGPSDGFDADVAIFTGEMRKLIPDLLDALGGEIINQEIPKE